MKLQYVRWQYAQTEDHLTKEHIWSFVFNYL